MESDESQMQGHEFAFLPITIRIETTGGVATPVVLRGTPLPATRVEVFSTASDNQNEVHIRLYAGESPLTCHNLLLLTAKVTGIAPAPRGQPKIRVSVSVDKQGRVALDAIDGASGGATKVSIQAAGRSGLTPAIVKKWIRKAEESRQADEARLQMIELRANAESLISKAEAALAGRTSSLGASIDRSRLAAAIASLGLALEADSADEIKVASTELRSVLNPLDFAQLLSQLTAKPQAVSSERQETRRHTPLADKGSISQPSSPTEQLGRIFGGGTFSLDPNLCFVLMPFASHLRPIYEDHVKPVVQSERLSCVRADEIVGSKPITLDIWEKINRARVVIADLTGTNANVFYELGLAHALGKDVILMTQAVSDVPFDLRAIRCIVYEYTPRGMKELEAGLRAAIRATMAAS